MASPLSGPLRKSIYKGLKSTFLPATLTRGTVAYPCRAIIDNYGEFSGPGGALTTQDCTILILAGSLSAEPNDGDIIAVSKTTFAIGKSFVVLSLNDRKNAVATDPAGAVWTLSCKAVPVQQGVYDVYAALAAVLGADFDVYRSTGSDPIADANKIETTKAVFTDGKGQGFNFDRPATYDDVLQNALLDASGLQVGDFLVGAKTYFIASMEPFRPVNAVECNAIISLSRSLSDTGDGSSPPPVRQPSQIDGTMPYWGRQLDQVGTTSPDNQIVASGIPACMIANAGRATGQVETPSGAPGPSRWRIYLPKSTFPKGTVKDRDYVTDDEGNRHLVSAAAWTEMGYRLESIREEL